MPNKNMLNDIVIESEEIIRQAEKLTEQANRCEDKIERLYGTSDCTDS